MYFMTSVSLNFKELELDFVFVKNLLDVWEFGVFPIHRADFIHGRPIRDGKGRCPVDSASMTTMIMMTTTVLPFLRPAGPAQWLPFSVVHSKLQISLVGKLLFSLDRL